MNLISSWCGPWAKREVNGATRSPERKRVESSAAIAPTDGSGHTRSFSEPMHIVAVFYYCVIGADAVWNWLFAPRFWATVVASLTLLDHNRIIPDLAEGNVGSDMNTDILDRIRV